MASAVGQPNVGGFVLRAHVVPTVEVRPRSFSVFRSMRRLGRTGSLRFLTMISVTPRLGHDQRPNVRIGPVASAVGQPIVGGFVLRARIVPTVEVGPRSFSVFHSVRRIGWAVFDADPIRDQRRA